MANELRIEAQLEYSKSGVKESRHDSVYIDVSRLQTKMILITSVS